MSNRWEVRATVAMWVILGQVGLGTVIRSASAAEEEAKKIAPPQSTRTDTDSDKERNFYEVLEDVVSDFEFDLKNNEVAGLKDLAIRNIATSENIPPSFKSHLELLITERILRNTRTRVIQCLPCKARRTTLNGEQVVITSAETNPAELSRIAKLSNIANFMDIAFSYQPQGIVMSMYITEPESGSILWSRSYNSETSRAAAFKRGVDYSQADDARKQTEYNPTLQFRGIFYFLFEPNIATESPCMGLGFRMVERYDNRKKEVGFEFDYMIDATSIINATSIPTTNLYRGFTLNGTLLFLHAWNLIGDEESYNKIRWSFFGALGGTYASGYLGALIRAGVEWRMAKRAAIQASIGYRPASTVFFGGTSAGDVYGFEYGVGISLLF